MATDSQKNNDDQRDSAKDRDLSKNEVNEGRPTESSSEPSETHQKTSSNQNKASQDSASSGESEDDVISDPGSGDSQTGNQQPPQGYQQQPPQGYQQQPSQGYQQPPHGYQQPPQGYQQPPHGYQQPPHGYPPQGYQQPPYPNQQPPHGYQQQRPPYPNQYGYPPRPTQQPPYPTQQRPPYPNQVAKGGKSGSMFNLNTIAALLFIGCTLVTLFLAIKSKLGSGDDITQGTLSQAEYKKMIDKFASDFGKVTPHDCQDTKYFGLNDEFDGLVQYAMPAILREETNLSDNNTRKNVLLYGLPGTGKTFFAKKLLMMLAVNIKAHKLRTELRRYTLDVDTLLKNRTALDELYDCNDTIEMYTVNAGEFLEKHVGETETKTKKFFQFLNTRQQDIPILIFIDEAESLLVKRTSATEGAGSVYNNVVVSWLTWLDGVIKDKSRRVIVVGATNYKSRIDAAIKRRFGVMIGIPLPLPMERETVLKERLLMYLSDNQPKALQSLVAQSEGLSLSRIVLLCEQIRDKMAKERIPPSLAYALDLFKVTREQIKREEAKQEADRKKANRDKEEDKDAPQGLESNIGYKSSERSPNLLVINKLELDQIEDQSEKAEHVDLKNIGVENMLLTHRPSLQNTKIFEMRAVRSPTFQRAVEVLPSSQEQKQRRSREDMTWGESIRDVLGRAVVWFMPAQNPRI
ncbi:fidgetin-like protein 1 [Nematocida homosporus]|uniref:fidgetin-like protein 1 n=1 Tax=Nematocida homosporus TaxID=1912981 RepID=UPI00221E7DDD|nr:fidgetin-like protein 1 [Nematocida homosporus]KAI5185289.1 fidgetin-like protein 1 [Nematocida homosporus]